MTDTEKAALERRIDELCAEVEQGKAEFKKMDAWHSQELKAAMGENAKLRKLVSDMWFGLYCPTEPTDGCPPCPFYKDGECFFESRMEELGNEVPS